jgi:glucosylceramidase
LLAAGLVLAATAAAPASAAPLGAPAGGGDLSGAGAGAGAPPPGPVSVVETSANLIQALAPQPSVQFAAAPPVAGVPVVTINDGVTYQRIKGFGAAMTDSSAWLIEHALGASQRAVLLSGLFGSSGLHLSFLRVPIGASDFTASGRPYTYDDVATGHTDPALRRFTVAHDRSYVIPALRAAISLNRSLKLLASPWTPPAWMKDNDALNDLAFRGRLRGAAYGPWAGYIVRFLRAYAAAGIPISALTPANEPGNPTRYPGLNMSPASIGIWVSRFLVPALRAAHLHPQLYGVDYGWDRAKFARALIASAARRALAGIAWHCYFGSPNVMSQLHAVAPALDEIVDECSPGISALPVPEVLIASLRNWASAIALWNLALNPSGGPVQSPNTGCPGCSGLATIVPTSGKFVPRLAWYQLGQASEFVQPGAVRVMSNTFAGYNYTKPGVNFVSPALDDVAFIDPGGNRVLLAYNNSPAPITFAVSWAGYSFQYALPAGATATFEWSP